LVAQYVRGDGELLAVIRPDGGGGVESRFYHADGLGSIRRLTDETGVVTDGYTYTAFGELTSHTGTDPQPYAFTGEPLDLNTGFQYHRARWMDPRTGRFAGMDPFIGRIQDPPSLHKYLYAGANVPNVVDPSGEVGFSLPGLNLSFSVQATIQGIAPSVGFGAVIGAIDASLAGQSPVEGALQGMALGALLGPLGKFKSVSRILTYTGIALAGGGAFDAYLEGNTGLALFRGILFVAGARSVLTARLKPSGPVTVYRSLNPKTGEVQYVGITNNLRARAAAHLRQKGIEIERISELPSLSRSAARGVEQVLIEYYGLGKNHGTLINKINSIARTNPIYAESLALGRSILSAAGYPFS
jgi:RHS repeat-associated protein